MTPVFEPTSNAARERVEDIAPAQYSKTRNALGGAVTYLSPYITHGLLPMPEVVGGVLQKFKLNFDDKLIFEFAWREFFHHVWRNLGDDIFDDVNPAPWAGHYAQAMPSDIVMATTGVPAIDQAVTQLYATGYLHNHARMWLASYIVHMRKVHWRVGAEWLYSHLLDGDLASNHLSWQWVAATFSSKPYLFNAENVAKYAPKEWLSNGSVIDQPYEQLEAIARGRGDVGPEPDARRKFSVQAEVPQTFSAPPADLLASFSNWPLLDAAHIPQRGMVHLVHPWSLGDYLNKGSARRLAQRIGLIHLPFHDEHPWSYARWQFVLTRMRSVTDIIFIGDAMSLLPGVKTGHVIATLNPHYCDVTSALAARAGFQVDQPPRQFYDPPMLCKSFTKFYTEVKLNTGRLIAVV